MPRSVFSHLETLLVVTLLLAATSSSADPVESAQPTIDDALIYEIITQARPVLLFTQLTNNRILVIIGSTKHNGIYFALNDAHVFEQPLENLGHNCIYLKPSTPFLTRWPAATGWYIAMFALPDSTGDNIILGERDHPEESALHLNTGTLEVLEKVVGIPAVTVLEYSWTLSSTEPVHYFYYDGFATSALVAHHFTDATLDQATNIHEDESYFICDNGLSSSGKQRIRVSSAKCQVPTKWNITTGFTNSTSVVLVDQSNAVLIFDRSALTSGQPTDVLKIPAEKFWVKWVPSLDPSNRTLASSTEKMDTKWTESTTAKWPVVLVLAIAVPNLLLVVCLIALGIYCFRKPKQPSDKSTIAKSPKVVGGSRNQQQDHKSAARTARKGGTKEKHGPSAANLKTKAARSSTGAKTATASRSSHLPDKSVIASKAASKVGKTSVGKSATAVSKASKNASTSKRSLAGPTALSSKASRVH